MNQQTAENDVSIKRIGGIVMQVAGPALTMLVVSSIAFFLIEIFYEGPFVGRVKWIFTLFCFAAVLVSRISIEEGFERATGFGFLLGLAMFLVAARFMQGNLLVLAGILAFVWWAAGRLTWDCTFIDETRDATGQGMIDLAIDRVNRFRSGKKLAAEKTSVEEDLPPDPDLVQGPDPTEKKPSSWDQFVRIFWKRKQPNTPGLWAFYFLLMGLPLFGIGQMMMKMTDEAGHRAAALHFFFYVLGLLGLLMLCSVLGLHRYLQNNQSSMPGNIARRWIVAGTILAIGITGFCFMLPRPTAKYSIGNWLPQLTTNNTSPSDNSFGNDGQEQGDNNNQPGGPKSRDNESQKNQQQNEKSGGGGNEQNSDEGAAKNTKGGKQGGGKSSDGKQGSGGDKKQNSKSQSGKSKQNDGKQKGKGGDSDKTSKQKSNEGESEQAGPDQQKSKRRKSLEESAEKNRKGKRNDKQKGKGSGAKSRSSGNKSSGSRSAGNRKSAGAKKEQSNRQRKSSTSFGSFMANLFKFIIFVVAVVVIGWFAIKHRSQILPWIRSFLAELAEFWNRLWNREKKERPKTEEVTKPTTREKTRLPGFAKYRNPFATDAAEAWPPERLVKYTFEAFEAWGRDHDCPRDPDQTALEFAQSVIDSHPTLKQEAITLANLYSQVAYAKGSGDGIGTVSGNGIISRSAAMNLAPLWEKLIRLHAPQPAVTA